MWTLGIANRVLVFIKAFICYFFEAIFEITWDKANILCAKHLIFINHKCNFNKTSSILPSHSLTLVPSPASRPASDSPILGSSHHDYWTLPKWLFQTALGHCEIAVRWRAPTDPWSDRERPEWWGHWRHHRRTLLARYRYGLRRYGMNGQRWIFHGTTMRCCNKKIYKLNIISYWIVWE